MVEYFFPGQRYFVYFGACYASLLVLLSIPYFQGHAVYLNAIKLPFFADFSSPERYGLAPNRTLNLKIQTPDNESIGAWFVLSDKYYHDQNGIPEASLAHLKAAVSVRPTVLFLHGNAATRAMTPRIRQYQGFTSRLNANVLAIDYRGFADSTGKPSEAGLTMDARAGFNFLLDNGAKPEDILVVGHSLGTGVSGQLAAALAAEKVKYRGLVLLSPFSSIAEVLETYNAFGFIPLIKPIALIPGAIGLVNRLVVHRFDTLKAVPHIDASVLIAHAEDDWDIPDAHSDVLFQAFLEPHLPKLDMPKNAYDIRPEEMKVMAVQRSERREVRDKLLVEETIKGFGRTASFTADGRTVTLVKTHYGGHDYLGVQEGLQDIIGKKFGLL